MTSTPIRTAGSLFGIDLAGLFKDDEDGENSSFNLQPFLEFTKTSKGRGGVLSFRPQQQTGTTSTLGFGGGGGSIQNINVVGSNVGANTGVIEDGVNVGGDDEGTTDPSPQLPQRFKPDADIRYGTDYMGNLTEQQATGKANQLLARALGTQLNQGLYNKLFEPLYKDLQTGNDYGLDMDRFYKSVREAGYEPYAGQEGIGLFGKEGAEGGYDSYAKFVENKFAKDGPAFYDMADAGRKFLEAKAFYRPGGEDTNLTKIGNIQERFDRGEMKFSGSGGNPYGGGYRAADFSGFADTRAGTKDFYENYLKGVKGEEDTGPKTKLAPTQLGDFENYDFASAGQAGFGFEDIKELSRAGAGTAQLRALAGKARDKGLNVGKRAEALLSQSRDKSGTDYSNFDFSKYGQGGYGLEDVKALLDQGATRRDLRDLGRQAQSRGLNVGGGVRRLFGGFDPSMAGGSTRV